MTQYHQKSNKQKQPQANQFLNSSTYNTLNELQKELIVKRKQYNLKHKANKSLEKLQFNNLHINVGNPMDNHQLLQKQSLLKVLLPKSSQKDLHIQDQVNPQAPDGDIADLYQTNQIGNKTQKFQNIGATKNQLTKSMDNRKYSQSKDNSYRYKTNNNYRDSSHNGSRVEHYAVSPGIKKKEQLIETYSNNVSTPYKQKLKEQLLKQSNSKNKLLFPATSQQPNYQSQNEGVTFLNIKDENNLDNNIQLKNEILQTLNDSFKAQDQLLKLINKSQHGVLQKDNYRDADGTQSPFNLNNSGGMIIVQDNHIQSKMTAARVISIYGESQHGKSKKLKDTLKNIISKKQNYKALGDQQISKKNLINASPLNHLSVDFSDQSRQKEQKNNLVAKSYDTTNNSKRNFKTNIIENQINKANIKEESDETLDYLFKQKRIQEEAQLKNSIQRKSFSQSRQLYYGNDNQINKNEPVIPPSLKLSNVRGNKLQQEMKILIQKTSDQEHQQHNELQQIHNKNTTLNFSTNNFYSHNHQSYESTNAIDKIYSINTTNQQLNNFAELKQVQERTSAKNSRQILDKLQQNIKVDEVEILRKQKLANVIKSSRDLTGISNSLEQTTFHQLNSKNTNNSHHTADSPTPKNQYQSQLPTNKHKVSNQSMQLISKQTNKTFTPLSQSVNNIPSIRITTDPNIPDQNTSIIQRRSHKTVQPHQDNNQNTNITNYNNRRDRNNKFNELMNRDWHNQFEQLQDNLRLVKNKEKRAKLMSINNQILDNYGVNANGSQDYNEKPRRTEKSVTFILPDIIS
eukprot:403336715